jgi:hypothetical protein
MDLMKMDSNYVPRTLVEGYSSLIWTERYTPAGEMELKTFDIERTLDLLPENTLLTLRDSREVMIVESRNVKVNKDDISELVVKGRTFESFLEQRPNVRPLWYRQDGGEAKAYVEERPNAYTSAVAAGLLVYPGIVAPTPYRLTLHPQIIGIPEYPEFSDPKWGRFVSPAEDVVPNTVVTDSTTTVEYNKNWTYSRDRYKDFLDFLGAGGLGVRMIRPDTPNNDYGYMLTTNERGEAGKIFADITNKLRFDIYNGSDRSSTIEFEYNLGHLNEPSYLFSNKEYKNIAYAVKENDPMSYTYVALPGVNPYVSGIARRVLVVPIPADVPNANIPAMALVELAKHNQSLYFDAEISPLAEYKYNRDYFLGDLVRLRGQYNVNQKMRVAEYIRAEDAEGERAYPTLDFAG